jgi:hypothetical protein
MVRCYNVSMRIEAIAIGERLLLVITVAPFRFSGRDFALSLQVEKEEAGLRGHLLFTA